MLIEKNYELPFPLERVYAAWVSSDTVISPATAMDINPVVGGHYRLIIDSEAFSARNEGHFLRVQPGQYLKYTWEWNSDGEITEIQVTFAETSMGTKVSIEHSGFVKPESVESHDSGWDSYINGLVDFLS